MKIQCSTMELRRGVNELREYNKLLQNLIEELLVVEHNLSMS